MVKRSRGFTYLAVLFALAILSSGLALIGHLWETVAKREKEAELLYIGDAYRRAIKAYYEATPSGVQRYPQRLEQLLKDDRFPGTKRYLRRLYTDPVTGGTKWGTVIAVDGGILGVFSLSTKAPLKIGESKLRDAEFVGAATYADWKFVYRPVLPPAPVSVPKGTSSVDLAVAQ